jgi:hypothetical protein
MIVRERCFRVHKKAVDSKACSYPGTSEGTSTHAVATTATLRV